jgi:pimeloyl-ACP methyl ester carboxylesterase
MENTNYEYCNYPNVSEDIRMINIRPDVMLKLHTFRPHQPTENPPVLFVAGWVSRMESWRDVLKDMSRDFVIYYLETREKCSSQISGKAEFGVEDIASDLVSTVQQLKLRSDNYIFFGSSLGASSIIEANKSLSELPICQVLISPNAVYRVPWLGMIIVRLTHPWFYIVIKEIVKWYLRTFRMRLDADYNQYKKYADALDAADPWKLKKAMIKLSKYQVWDMLSAVETPTIIIGGHSDTLHEPENLQRMASLMKNAQYIDMETNSHTHSPMVVNQLRQFLMELKQHKKNE